MNYAIPYIIITFFFGICAYMHEYYEEEEKKRNVNILAIAVFFIFFAFRGYLYSDWTAYVYDLENVEWSDLTTWDMSDQKAHEPGFVILCLLCKSIINEYAFLVFVCVTIDTVLFLRFLKRRGIDNVAFVFVFFVAFEGLGLMFNLLRNAIAIFLFLNALEYIEKREPLKYFLVCVICFCFHFSSLFFFPLYFFLHRNLKRVPMICICIGSFVFYLSHISIISSIVQIFSLDGVLGYKLTAYTELFTATKSFGITKIIEKLGLAVLVFIYYDEILQKGKRQILINCYVVYFFFYYVTAEFNVLSERMAVLFCFSVWILWVDVIKSMALRNNKILLSAMLGLYISYVFVSNIQLPIQEYDNLLFGGKSQQERLKIYNKTYEPDE